MRNSTSQRKNVIKYNNLKLFYLFLFIIIIVINNYILNLNVNNNNNNNNIIILHVLSFQPIYSTTLNRIKKLNNINNNNKQSNISFHYISSSLSFNQRRNGRIYKNDNQINNIPSRRLITASQIKQSNNQNDNNENEYNNNNESIRSLHNKLYNDDNYNNNNNVTFTADDIRRRQILMTMLSTATITAASTLRPKEVNAAIISSDKVDSGISTSNNNIMSNEFNDLIVPPLDDREYLSYTLSNGLRILLCSDNSTNEAAAAMDVHVGACSDPINIQGLAHFNEHMLFLGTKQYPIEDSFSKFLSSNSGSSNAYTDSENTVYYFDMVTEIDTKFDEGLSRFGSFFIHPLFTESATLRELNAIESENSKNIQSDLFRQFQIDKSRANINHPYNKFFTGNKKTLYDNTKLNNIDLRKELIKFYNTYYSANQMTLAIVAPISINILKDIINKIFINIPNYNINKPENSWTGILPYNNDNSIIPSFNNIVEIVPVQELRQINIKWPIIYNNELDKVSSLLIKPSTYIAHLIGHEGENSLLSYLKNKMSWVNSISASTNEELSDFEAFEIVLGLTPQGLNSINNIVESIYSYINMLKTNKIPDYIYKEVLQLEELQWRFLSKGNPRNYVTSLSTSMQKYPPLLYVAGPRRLALDEYATNIQLSRLPRSSFPTIEQLDRTQNEVNKYIQKLNVNNAIMTVMSKTFENSDNLLKERWYGTEYQVRPIANDVLDQWTNCIKYNKLKLNYPKPNIFIPTEAGLKVKIEPIKENNIRLKTFEERIEPLTPPRIIRNDERWTVYFKEDNKFGKPNGYIIFEVLTKEVFANSMNAALANLYEISVTDRLGEYAYDAGLAGLIYDVKVLPRGLRLTFGGYNDKLKKFASFLSRKLSREVKDLLPKNDNEFSRYKDQIMRALTAFDVKQPYAHASYYSQITLQPRKFQYSNKVLREATRKTTLPDLVDYVNTLWSSGKGEALIQGNFNEIEALDLVKNIGDVLPFKPITDDEYPPRLQALPLPTSIALQIPPRLLIAEPNPANDNSVSYVMLQSLDRSEKDHMLIELLNSIVEEPFYNELRTKKQLGYIVASGVKGIENTRTLSFIVQSNVASADSLTIEILSFLDQMESNILAKITKGDFAVYVKSLIDKKTEPDKDLATEVTRNWSEIASGRLQFNRRQKEVIALLDLEKKDILEFWQKLYSTNGRRILITEMIPRQGDASSELPPTSTRYDIKTLSLDEPIVLGIDDIESFRSDREKIIV